MQRVHDSTVITLLRDSLPDSASQSYLKERKTTQVPKDKQKGKSFEGAITVGDFPKVRPVFRALVYITIALFRVSFSKGFTM